MLPIHYGRAHNNNLSAWVFILFFLHIYQITTFALFLPKDCFYQGSENWHVKLGRVKLKRTKSGALSRSALNRSALNRSALHGGLTVPGVTRRALPCFTITSLMYKPTAVIVVTIILTPSPAGLVIWKFTVWFQFNYIRVDTNSSDQSV